MALDTSAAVSVAGSSEQPDDAVIRQVLDGNPAQFELLMRRYNERVYRAARAIVRDEQEAEDVMQQAYVNAFTHLRQFRGSARFSTWLTRIAINESLARVRRHRSHAAFDDERFALAEGLFISADGRSARMVVVGATDAFGNASIDRTEELRETTELALADGPLAGSTVESAGMPSSLADIRSLSNADFLMVALVALLVVLVILLVLLRSVVASVFLLASVVLSYASAIGLGVLVWQVLLDKPLDWTVPSIAFTLLVAVGADYNMLLIKRIRDEAPDGSAAGVARALAVTGSVITAAGLIFAGSVFAMMAGSVVTLMQIGFTIGMGLLLDTFVVRTLVVPAFAALVGPRLWWPGAARAH